MRSWIALAALAVALAAPAAAPAQVVDTGLGSNAHIVVDATGAAHIASQTDQGHITRYCRVVAGATGCVASTQLAYDSGPNEGSPSGTWPLLPGDNRVLVIDARCCQSYAQKYVYTFNADGSAGPFPREDVGKDDNLGSSIQGAALYAPPGALGRPAESILTFGDLATIGLSFQATGTTGPPTLTRGTVLTQGNSTNGALAFAGNTVLAAWIQLSDGGIYSRAWSGSGDINDEASWGPIAPASLPGTPQQFRLVGGPSGFYLAYSDGQSVLLRQWDGGSGFIPVAELDSSSPSRFDIALDADGVIHYAAEDPSDGSLVYRRALGSGNAVFTQRQTVLPPNQAAGGYSDLRLATGGGRSWVSWTDSSPSHVRAVQVGTLPPPEQGENVNAVPVRGKVRVRVAGTNRFVALEDLGAQVPVGSTFDTRRGTVRLTAATEGGQTSKAGFADNTQSGTFRGGQFRVTQGTKNPLTTLSMNEAITGCKRRPPRGGAPKVEASRARRRRVFGNARGRFRTRGRHSTATVRGTRWSVTDTCRTTITKVTSGRVVVRDLVRRRSRTLRRGQSYVARRGHG